MSRLTSNTVKKMVAVSVALLLCGGGSFAGYQYYLTAQAASAPEQVYKESTVQRGDITVGVSETGSATIEAVGVRSGVEAEVEEVLVKPGQSVMAGDPLVRLSLDSVQEKLATLQISYEKAKLAVSESEISKTLSTLDAEATLTENQLKAQTAEKTYELTLDQAEYEYINEQASLSELSSTLSDYRDQLDSLDDDRDTLISSYNTAENDLVEAMRQLLTASDRTDSDGNAAQLTSEELSGLSCSEMHAKLTDSEQSSVTRLYEKWDSADEKIDTFDDGLEEKEAEIEEKIASTKRSIASKQLSLEQSETNNELEKLTAEVEKSTTLQTGENADLLYNLTLQKLDNSLKSSQLSLQEIEQQIADLQQYSTDGVITAPCDGLIMSLSCAVGDTVAENAEVAQIADQQNTYAVVSIDQEDISDVKIGNSANVTFSAYDEIKFTGIIDNISITPARAGSSTVTYTVTILLEGDASAVYEGMTCDVTFITKEVNDVLYVSNRAVTSVDGKEYVKVKRADGTIEQLAVTTGFSDGRNVEITEGLAENDTVLIESTVRQQA